jgi:cytoskeletal protein RodZ
LEKKISLDDVSKATKIKVKFLEAIEKSDYQDLPSSSYAQGFVRNYALFLGFSEREIMPIFRREFDSDKEFKVLPKGLAQKDDIPIQKIKLGRTFGLIFVVFILLIGYLLFQYRFAFIDPPLSLQSPKENAAITASEVDVVGKTDSSSTVVVQGLAVSVDQNGNFKKSIDVFQGPVTIKVKATSRFGKESEVDRHITIQAQ